MRPTREQFRIISGESCENGLRVELKQVPVDQRKLKYKGSITSAKLLSAEKATKDEVLKISRFLNNTNFRIVTGYKVVLSKLHWFGTNHHMGTEREGIARGLVDASDRAMRAMPLEDSENSDVDVGNFFLQHPHTISHWASSHLVCGGLYDIALTHLWVLSLGEAPELIEQD